MELSSTYNNQANFEKRRKIEGLKLLISRLIIKSQKSRTGGIDVNVDINIIGSK